VVLHDGGTTGLSDVDQFSDWTSDAHATATLILCRHGLHVELIIDPALPAGVGDRAGIVDTRLESALSAIMDCEDSVAAVDMPPTRWWPIPTGCV
jgi:malate synthase